jgi:glucose/arabinose dehydrogenase
MIRGTLKALLYSFLGVNAMKNFSITVVAFLIYGAGLVEAAIPNNVTFKDFFESALTFQRPLFFTEIPGKPDHYLVVEKTGKAMVATKTSGAWVKAEFLTLQVAGGGGNNDEQGFLGFAFHPKYAENRKYYVNYIPTGGGRTLIMEGVADETLLKSSGDSLRTLLSIKQPAVNHNGGSVVFSPKDGFLYIGMGDGGGGGDTYKNSRGPDTTMLSKFLRIDVDNPADGKPYGIPADNPNVGKAGALPEVFARGLRNPWRYTFHHETGDLWVGDVGQGAWEEIAIVKKNEDHGWNLREGLHCYSGGGNCEPEGITDPILELEREEARCITGGEFFTGDPASAFYGVYIFGDKETGKFWAIRNGGTETQEMLEIGKWAESTVSAFGKDRLGRVFATNHMDGKVYVLQSPDMVAKSSRLRPRRGEALPPMPSHRFAQIGFGWEASDLQGRAWNRTLPSAGIVVVRREGNKHPQLMPILD